MPTGCFTKQKDTSNTITITHMTPTLPVISINASSNTVCAGTQVTYTATTNILAGTYKWKVGGSVVGNTNTYIYTPANNDQVSCTIEAPAGCYMPDTGNSNVISVTVNPKVTPAINITGPATVGEHALVNLSAILTNAGSNYTIDWQKNGNSFANTSTPNTSYYKGKGTDNIVATITPLGCYNTATSNSLVITEAVSVEKVGEQGGGLMIYPNPTSSEVHIQGLSNGDIVEIYDAAGKKISGNTSTLRSNIHIINVSNIATGTYLLEIKTKDGTIKARKKIQKL